MKEREISKLKSMHVFVKSLCAGFVNNDYQVCCDAGNTDKTQCLVLNKKRCQWFEKCLLPLLVKYGNKTLIKKYESLSKQVVPKSGNFCNDCGNEVGARMRYCEECKEVRRRQTQRKEKARQRQVACPTINEK